MNARVAVSAVGVSMIVLFVAITGMHKETNRVAEPVAAPSFPQAQLDAMGALVRASGYSCKTPINARNMLISSGFVLHCHGDRLNTEYWFDIEDRGGRLVVAPR